MGQQILFLKKNFLDLDSDNIDIIVTDAIATNNGQSFVDYMRNRKNDSAWITTGSTDAANTTLEIDMSDDLAITDIIVLGHNLGDYTIKYWTGVAWADFSTTIAETSNTETTNHYNFTEVSTQKIQIIITGAQVVDADKYIKQLIITNRIGDGQLEGWPEIKTPRISTNKKKNKMLSGKLDITESVGAFSASLNVKNWNISDDLDIIEEIYFSRKGVLMWLCGGDDDQFSSKRIGYRKEDIYLVRPTDEYTPEFYKNYTAGLKIKMKVEEVVA